MRAGADARRSSEVCGRRTRSVGLQIAWFLICDVHPYLQREALVFNGSGDCPSFGSLSCPAWFLCWSLLLSFSTVGRSS
jgi:hypothetical protein